MDSKDNMPEQEIEYTREELDILANLIQEEGLYYIKIRQVIKNDTIKNFLFNQRFLLYELMFRESLEDIPLLINKYNTWLGQTIIKWRLTIAK